MPIKQVVSGETKYPVKIWTDQIEEGALAQVKHLGNLPFIHKHVAVMPDVHAGRGSTIGTVFASKSAVIPAAVGVDIGCGMAAVKLEGLKPADLEGKLSKIRHNIERAIPLGHFTHKAEAGFKVLNPKEREAFVNRADRIEARARSADRKQSKIIRGIQKFPNSIGSLGGGNHFIEICVSPKDEVWMMLHSGSRGTGNIMAQFHMEVAKDAMKKMFINLPDPDLSYVVEGTQEFEHYMEDMLWCQDFAKLNRKAMRLLVLDQLHRIFNFSKNPAKFDVIDCHHNYVDREHHYGENVWVTRKGAVRAREGDLGIIPGSMGAKSFIVSGRGSEESFCSCSHGAGRVMSRSKAKKQFTEADLLAQTAGVECRKDSGVIDEIPGAYKNIEEVMANQSDLVEVVEELKQVVCVKG